MQFLCLFSFVVVASYAAALPQPAGLSKKYSNSVGANLASILEARSYQPAFNSQKNSATLVSLKRRDDSEGSSGENSGSRTSLSPTPTPKVSGRKLENSFEVQANALFLAPGIDKVGDGLDKLPNDMGIVEDVIGGKAGEMVVLYLKRALYVNDNLQDWKENIEILTVDFIKAGLGDAEYSKLESAIEKTVVKFLLGVRANLMPIRRAISYAIREVGSATQNVEAINVSFKRVFGVYKEYFEALKLLLAKFPEGKDAYGFFTDANVSLDKFSEKQQKLHDEIVQALKAAPSK
ncbi:hypothetical protein BASA61_009723 [Batrachochytrium salamandrivorans]|nr:hypothetical protein BASA62_009300 [Batrachochytrium salamandrivorans]KAH6580292.1 hypothetical protein BASA61_009723 [Batrachochytrium salamandrivorans]KAH9264512.1 hypothetical protein BASA83_011983 [Batrachochytrium salamandrivorans]